MELNRRSFVASGAISAAVASVAAGTAVADEAAAFDMTTDVLVLGAGAGGCFAANFAMQQGAKVTVVEAASKVAGTPYISGGFFHTWDITPENVDEMMSSADAHRRRLFIETWQGVRDWALENAAGASPLDMDYPLYGAHLIGFSTAGKEGSEGIRNFLVGLIEGADLIVNTYFKDLIVDETGAVLGAVVQNKQGEITRIGAKSVVIATGSFQNNREMIEEHLGRWADNAVCRATPYNKGAGIKIAMKYGARMSNGCGHFYGHLNPWPPLTPMDEESFENMGDNIQTYKNLMGAIQKFSVEGICLNRNGLRFTDEGPENYVGDNYLANDAMQEADGHVLVIIDSAQDNAKGLETILENGGVVVEADTIEELAEALVPYKMNPYNMVKTIKEYQEYAAEDRTMELTIPKSPMPTGYLTLLDTPPYFAVQAAAGISGFYGGIDVDDDCCVYGNGDQVIPNLYAAPMASGGYFYKEYGGGLALCATFGAVAGKTAGMNAMM